MTELEAHPAWWSRVTALFEVFAVFLGGRVLSIFAARVTGLASSKALISEIPEGGTPDFFGMAGITALELILRYGIMFGLAFAVGWWHRRRRLARYGVTLAGTPASRQVGTGIILFAVIGLLPALLMLIQNHVSLGEGADHWTIFSYDWNVGFWVFMFVSSFGLVPIVEELFTRGYFQTRLTEDLGPWTAILITAVVFAFGHTQYYKLELLSLGMLFSIIFGSIVGGYIFYRTRSLVPVIVAHAIGNIPWKGVFDYLVPALALIIIVVYRRTIITAGKELFATVRGTTRLPYLAGGVVIMAGVVVTLLLAQNLLAGWAVVLVIIASVFLIRDRRLNVPIRHESVDHRV
ncbi:lysostaphin resistance A-like protein [Gemmatimonadota bacterium]